MLCFLNDEHVFLREGLACVNDEPWTSPDRVAIRKNYH